MKPEGNVGADALADANNAWWSVTAWQERRLMQAYVDSEPHLGISARLDHYCDEATFVPGEEAAGAFRSVQAGSARLIGPLWTLPYCGELQPKLQPADLPRLPVPQLAGDGLRPVRAGSGLDLWYLTGGGAEAPRSRVTEGHFRKETRSALMGT